MASSNRLINAYIAKEDLKKTYRQPQVGLHRIRAYSKSIERMETLGITQIEIEKTTNDTIKFTITAESTKEAKQAKKYIQGAFCHESAVGKYDEPDLPEKNVKGISGTREAQKELSDRDQQMLQSEGKQFLLTEEALRKHDIKHMQGPCELRQFGCRCCRQSWWRTVLKSKPVSRCRKCQQRYDALPRNKEFGIGRYHCTKPSCGRKFFAKCEATDRLMCRKCKTIVSNPYIHPRWKKAARVRSSQKRLNPGAVPFVPKQPPKTRFESSHIEPVFVPMSEAYHEPPNRTPKGFAPFQQYQVEELHESLEGLSLSQQSQEPQQAPPQPASSSPPPKPRGRATRKKIFNPSTLHNSDGQTLSTFITQMNDDGQSVDLDYDSDDEGVDACRFECDCGNKYTVACELNRDTTPCYKCGRDNPALGWARGDLSLKESGYRHSCCKCNGRTAKSCPNLKARRSYRGN